jgi:hypothetical protein
MVTLPSPLIRSGDLASTQARKLHLLAYKQVELWIQVTALNGSPLSPTLDAKIQHKQPFEGTHWIDISGKSITQVTTATTLPSSQIISLASSDIKSGDMRLVITPSFTSGTSPSWTVNINWLGKLA